MRIGDFGDSSDQETALTIVGTPGYFAPEILDGKGYTQQSDMYSVGIILLDLLSLKTPGDCVEMDVKERIASIPKFYSKHWTTILTHLLAKKPELRLTIERLREYLFKLQGSLPSGPVVRPADSKDLTNNTEIKMIIDNIFNHEINKNFQTEKVISSSDFRDLICAYFNEHHTPLQYGGEHS